MPSYEDTPAVLINSANLLASVKQLNNLTVGQRVSGDKLTQSYSVQIPPNPWSITMLYRVFQLAAGQSITQVQVSNLEQHLNTSYVLQVAGGPGARTIGLLFASKINESINFAVRIYAI